LCPGNISTPNLRQVEHFPDECYDTVSCIWRSLANTLMQERDILARQVRKPQMLSRLKIPIQHIPIVPSSAFPRAMAFQV
jgi:hypothetical protein